MQPIGNQTFLLIFIDLDRHARSLYNVNGELVLNQSDSLF